MSATVEARNLTKKFGRIVAVDDVSFTATAGQVVGFLGPNGAGKSTTMKMLTGFLPPCQGSAFINGVDVVVEPVLAKKQLGYLPEGAPCYTEMTVQQFLSFVAQLRGYGGYQRLERISEVVNQVYLQDVLEQRIETLSKGFKRRLGLAQALLHQPSVLILDEPTDGLDPNQKHEVRTLITELAKNRVIMLSTHILEEVEAVCHRVIVINNGQIMTDCTPAQLQAKSPHHQMLSLRLLGANLPQVSEALSGVKALQPVQMRALDDPRPHVHLEFANAEDADVVGLLNDLIAKEKWNILELRQKTGHLDEVFRAITTNKQAS